MVNDRRWALLPLVEAVHDNIGAVPTITLADSGYASEDTFAGLEGCELVAVVALGREGKASRALDPARFPATQRMAERLAMAEGQAHYRWRKVIPAPVFGWIKEVLGFRRFSVRGLAAVTGEWHLAYLAQNLKRLQRLGWVPA